MVQKNQKEKGAVTVEAAFVMPITIAVIIFLIYIAIVQIEYSFVHSCSQIIGQKICNTVCFPGYNLISDDPINQYSDEIYAIHDPYRYILMSGIEFDEYQDLLISSINKYTMLSGTVHNPRIRMERDILSTAIYVELDYKILMPWIVELIGLDRYLYFTVSTVTYANDSIEFMRNFDFTSDVICNLMQKYSLGSKIEDIYHRLISFIK